MTTVNLGKVQGDSAYQTYVKKTTDDPIKTEIQWLSSLNMVKAIEVRTADPQGSDLWEGRMWIIEEELS